jgi:hypothetical protein
MLDDVFVDYFNCREARVLYVRTFCTQNKIFAPPLHTSSIVAKLLSKLWPELE